jgi:DNA-binding GntR family transcriptional regulator
MNRTATIGRAALAPIRSRSLASQIADRLVDTIASSAFEPGQRLVETEVAASLGVSRVPLREALKLLEGQGILAVTPRRGACIVPFDDGRTTQICEARLALERIALRSAGPLLADDTRRLAALDGWIEEMRVQAERQAWLSVSKADLEFHRAILAASENDVVTSLWEALARQVLIVFGREIRDERDGTRLQQQHRRLCDLLAAGDAASLDREIERHIMRLRAGESR